ncbi:hypothetical protein [Kitasatospora sp. NPDC051914]|uniref:hypothetical protein n=1 Tax=Kitasatospora sp. NPDC051914 TaxID=3154945 RepID=UPI0034275274
MFWIGVALWGLVGWELGAVASGAAELGSGAGIGPFVIGVNAVPWTTLLAVALLRSGHRRRLGLTTTGPMSPAVARVESATALDEGPDHTVRLDLTVAPADRSAYRVDTKAQVNVMDLDLFRAGRTVPVEFDPERPWHVRVRPKAHRAWTGLAKPAPIDSAPPATRRSEPPYSSRRPLLFALFAVVDGLVLYFLLV